MVIPTWKPPQRALRAIRTGKTMGYPAFCFWKPFVLDSRVPEHSDGQKLSGFLKRISGYLLFCRFRRHRQALCCIFFVCWEECCSCLVSFAAAGTGQILTDLSYGSQNIPADSTSSSF
ncbi:hypothetical protein D7X87_18575 [bacterium D16-54]|nr:hypothetical protein D7X87_18575 [bacterium D16-54]RKJ12551.1 hypothetical protein D7X65_18735 [bacterium D16-56]